MTLDHILAIVFLASLVLLIAIIWASLIDRRIAREAAALVPVVPALDVAKVQSPAVWRRSRRSTRP